VKANIEEAVAPMCGASHRFEEVEHAVRRGHRRQMNKLLEEQANLQDKIEAGNGWELDRVVEIAMDALRSPRRTTPIEHALGRRAAARGAVPSPAREARSAAARRAHQPPRRRERRVARALPARVPGTVVAITHDRYFLDNVAGWILELDRGQGSRTKGNYSAGSSRRSKRLELEEKQETARQKTLARELEWVRMAPKRAAGQEQGAPHRVRELLRRGPGQEGARYDRDPHPVPARASATSWSRQNLKKAYGDRLLVDDLNRSRSRAAASSA
jgi:sulfate-transporting ATPase